MSNRDIGRYIAGNLNDTTNIIKDNDIKQKRRGEQLLLISPNSGSWIVLEPEDADFWRRMGKVGSWQDYREREHALTVVQREELMGRLYRAGMTKWNGRGYYNVDTMWKCSQTRYPTFLCLHLTEACNFACKYCMADSVPSNGRMSVETMELIISKCLHELPVPAIRFDFHGGEPLLMWDQMLHGIRFARELNEKEKLGKTLGFIFQTNGSLLTPDKVQVLIDEHIDVGVSMDGPAEVHDKNRIFAGSAEGQAGRGTHALVEKNLLKALEMGLKTGVLGVVHDPADYLKCFYYFVDKLQLRSFRLNFSSLIGRSARELEFHATRAEAFAENWLAMIDAALAWCREHDQPLHISDIDNQINNLTSKSRPFMCYRSPCGIGSAILGFAIDGGVHACEEMASSGVLRLGSVYDEGFNLKDMVDNSPLLKKLHERTVDNLPRCRRCEYRHICSGGCTSKALAYYGDYMHESTMCRFYQRVFLGLMWRIYDNRADIVKYLGK